jgi:DNA polymerase
MDIITVDFETYYDKEFSLKHLSTEAYVRDNRFEIIMAGLKINDRPAQICTPKELGGVLKEYPDSLWLAHNCYFDGFILEQYLDHHPSRLCCTALMARYLGITRLVGSSLRSLAQSLDAAPKGDFLTVSLGRRRSDFSPAELSEFEDYCKHDTDLTYQLFANWRPYVPAPAFDMMDMTLRMYTRPMLRLDRKLLTEYRDECVRRQEEAWESLQAVFQIETREEFLKAIRSKDKFASMLRRLGAKVPMKFSEAQAAKVELAEMILNVQQRDKRASERAARTVAKGPMIPALAKTDEEFLALLDHPKEEVALLARLRMENNSSLALTRAETFLDIRSRGPLLPVPLTAWGAHTGRYTAGRGDKINLQNLPKHTSDKALRQAITAPEGHVLVAGDSAQIEARVGAWLAGQQDLVELFRRGEDPYVDMAAAIWNLPAAEILHGAKIAKDPFYIKLRTIGKLTVLSSQYGIGCKKFASYLTRAGIDLAEGSVSHLEKARRINEVYNAKNSFIKAFRFQCQELIRILFNRPGELFVFSRLTMNCFSGRHAVIVLPGGYKLVYPDLDRETDPETGRDEYYYTSNEDTHKTKKYIYGGLLFNNLVQSLAFDILWRQGVEINKKYRVVSNVHDSWIVCCPEAEAERARAHVLECLLTPPDWAPDLPLGAEAAVSHNYEVA